MKKSARPYICTFIIALCTSCSVSKFIPEDKYLLDEVRIVSETKEVKPSLFNSYIRQNPNAKWFNLVKIPMRTYCVSGVDSTKWINRFFRKIGDAPVIYDESVALKSRPENSPLRADAATDGIGAILHAFQIFFISLQVVGKRGIFPALPAMPAYDPERNKKHIYHEIQ